MKYQKVTNNPKRTENWNNLTEIETLLLLLLFISCVQIWVCFGIVQNSIGVWSISPTLQQQFASIVSPLPVALYIGEPLCEHRTFSNEMVSDAVMVELHITHSICVLKTVRYHRFHSIIQSFSVFKFNHFIESNIFEFIWNVINKIKW